LGIRKCKKNRDSYLNVDFIVGFIEQLLHKSLFSNGIVLLLRRFEKNTGIMVLRFMDWVMALRSRDQKTTRSRPFKLPALLKIKHFEFWNTHLFHLPIYLYWLFLSCKARSLFFFSAANPGIETGGMIGESKYRILKKIDPHYLPKTIFYSSAPAQTKLLADIEKEGISFPFVVKPDIGQGGWLIQMIHDKHELDLFLAKIKMPFMVQEYIDYEIELGLLYYRFPGSKNGRISSVAVKELLSVTGDGTSTLLQLVEKHERAKGQLPKLSRNKRIELNRIPEKGEKIKLSFVGNHSYGTMFLNANHLVDEQLALIFDKLCLGIDGFYFGRFDLRCKSIADLKAGDFKILELNGAGSEPLHIFDPAEKIAKAYRSAFEHWRIIYTISELNRKAGVCYMELKEALKVYKHVRAIQQTHNVNFTIGN
jgi:hypothetical protein